MSGNPYGIYSGTPSTNGTPSRYSRPSSTDNSPSRSGRSSGSESSPGRSGRTSGNDSSPGRFGRPDRSGGSDRSDTPSRSPGRGTPTDVSPRGNGNPSRGSDSPSAPSARPGGGTFQVPDGPVGRNRRGGSSGPDRMGGYDRGTGTVTPTRDPAAPTLGASGTRPGGFNPPDGIAGGMGPVRSWRPPSRMPSQGGNFSGVNPGGAPNTNIPKRIGTGHPVEFSPSHRPPSVDHRHWRDRDWYYGGRHFYTIGLGYGSPFYCYDYPSFFSINFYYPYYYCGPYFTGAYYSPFWVYGGWLPEYVYPERVIYIEKRVYIHDVIQDDDDYDLYGNAMQSSLRDTLDDIKSAWLNGDGGRLLQHINEMVPVRIFQRGEYKYSLQPEDFRDMTKDALNRVQTVSFEWTKIDKRHSDEVYLEARQVFRDPDGEDHTVRLTYTLEKAKGGWWITETGTSKWDDGI